ncbi:MAG: hypothetical protein LQ351_005884 [Letrouitia transgressa]|nr:MAG: hypothetical protein LQ351_005884 [Letrouitia transgressa]
MARRKQATPVRREPSDFDRGPPEPQSHGWKHANGNGGISDPSAITSNGEPKQPSPLDALEQPGITQLLIGVTGIYTSFLTWGILQERITTTSYGPASSPVRFTFPVVLNTIQSSFAAMTGYMYLLSSTKSKKSPPAVFPTRSIIFPLVLVSITSSLASPFGYASLAHIDYITFILAKSCKLLPVMFLHLTIFRKRYPLYKYLVVALVTAGVAVFTLHQPSKKTSSPSAIKNNSIWGLFLLFINLLFDGLTNSTQDHIFTAFRPYTGPQMMVAQNILSTLLTTLYLLVSPLLANTPLFSILGIPPSSANELKSAIAFVSANPAVARDALGFAACGAIGQIFIYYTLAHFST